MPAWLIMGSITKQLLVASFCICLEGRGIVQHDEQARLQRLLQ